MGRRWGGREEWVLEGGVGGGRNVPPIPFMQKGFRLDAKREEISNKWKCGAAESNIIDKSLFSVSLIPVPRF